jgi:DinB superfamily
MEMFTAWFQKQLENGLETFLWAVEQVPEERRWPIPPLKMHDWSVVRHAFHLLHYERELALPAMRQWLGQPSTITDESYEEDAEWLEGHELADILDALRQVRAEEIAMLTSFDEDTWQRKLNTVPWDEVDLKWVLTKTVQHTCEHTHDILSLALFWDFALQQQQEEAL